MASTIFDTNRRESLVSKVQKLRMNYFPVYRRTGGRVCFLSDDWKEVHVKLDVNRGTMNYVGTVFGGSSYGAIDPIYMVQLIKLLGKEFIVWDKAAVIKYLKPIPSPVFARFIISDDLIAEITEKVKKQKKYTIELPVSFKDTGGSICAEAVKTLHIVDRSYFEGLTKKSSR
jgi:hypothetical protein